MIDPQLASCAFMCAHHPRVQALCFMIITHLNRSLGACRMKDRPMSNSLARKARRLTLLESLLRKLVDHSRRSCDSSSLCARVHVPSEMSVLWRTWTPISYKMRHFHSLRPPFKWANQPGRNEIIFDPGPPSPADVLLFVGFGFSDGEALDCVEERC